jgi:TetR/AcrR family transcriptional regulator, repressor of fatR-cypB operon
MGRRLKTVTENENLQQTILDSALKLFTTKGYFNTSIQDIRRDANISIGAVYHYFAGKEELASALYDSLLQQITADFLAIRENYATAHDQCKAIMKHLFDLTETNPAQMAFMLYAKHSEFIPTVTPICSSKPFAIMREMVQGGIDNKEIVNLDLTIVSNCLFGGMFRLINLRLDNTVTDPLPEQLEAVWDCSWRSIAAHPE